MFVEIVGIGKLGNVFGSRLRWYYSRWIINIQLCISLKRASRMLEPNIARAANGIIPMQNDRKIITVYDPPPIPFRDCDYQATREGWDLGDPIGHGETPAEAIADLLQEEELHS